MWKEIGIAAGGLAVGFGIGWFCKQLTNDQVAEDLVRRLAQSTEREYEKDQAIQRKNEQIRVKAEQIRALVGTVMSHAENLAQGPRAEAHLSQPSLQPGGAA